MISKILVAMDGSESSLRAYEYASFLARQCDAALIIVNICDVFEKITDDIKQELGDIAKKIEAEGGTGITMQLLEDYKSQAKGSGIKDVKTIRREGNAAAEILHLAEEENVDSPGMGQSSDGNYHKRLRTANFSVSGFGIITFVVIVVSKVLPLELLRLGQL